MMNPVSAPSQHVVRFDAPVSVTQTLGPLRRGRHDPCHIQADGAVWRSFRTTDGVAVGRFSQMGHHEVGVTAWGPGADHVIASAPILLGGDDNPHDFDPVTDKVAAMARRHLGARIVKTGNVIDALVAGVLEQRVIGSQAFASWAHLVRRYGEQVESGAPRPMWVAPTPRAWSTVPSWEWHSAGVDPGRARAIARALPHVPALQADTDQGNIKRVYQRLQSIPGIGVWTAAQVGHRTLGDPDAIAFGDYHLGRIVGWGLLGHVIDLDEVEAVVEPWRGHRHRLVRYLELTPGTMPPRRGPRLTKQDHRTH